VCFDLFFEVGGGREGESAVVGDSGRERKRKGRDKKKARLFLPFKNKRIKTHLVEKLPPSNL
jgi:hypothetical protein